MDSSITADDDASPDSDDIQVPLDTLKMEGTEPSKGDHVEITVGGKITQIVNDVAFVTPETVNGQPIPSEQTVNETSMMSKAGAADAQGMPIGY